MDFLNNENNAFDIGDMFEKPAGVLNDLNLENPDAAIAFMACSPDSDYANLVATLSLTMSVPAVGLTCVGQPFDMESATEPFGSHISFMGKKNTSRSIAVSDILAHDRADEQMAELYNKCAAALPDTPKLFFLFMPVMPDSVADDFLAPLFKLCGEAPIIGGMASGASRSTTPTAAFAFDKTYPDRLVLLGLSGDIRPAFGIARVPAGSIDPDAIASSTRDAVTRLKDHMAAIGQGGRRFDSLFAISCVERYNAMLSQPNVEAAILNEELGDGALSGFGFYAFKEIGPVPDGAFGLKNERHEQSLVLCAI